MKFSKWFIILFSLVFLFGIIYIPSSAVGSVSLYYDMPYLTFSFVDDPDDGFEYFYLRYRTYGESTWVTTESWSYSDLIALEYSYRIPDSVISYIESGRAVEYQFVGSSADSTAYSSVITIYPNNPDSFDIVLRLDSGNVLVWTSPFETGSVTYSIFFNGDTFQAVRYSYNKYIEIPSIFFSAASGYSIINQDTLTVQVQCVYNGTTYISNPVKLSGVPDYTVSIDTSLYRPSETDIDSVVELLYSGVTHTNIYRYVFSALAFSAVWVGLVFVIKWVH